MNKMRKEEEIKITQLNYIVKNSKSIGNKVNGEDDKQLLDKVNALEKEIENKDIENNIQTIEDFKKSNEEKESKINELNDIIKNKNKTIDENKIKIKNCKKK